MIWLVTAPATEDEEKGVGLAFVFESTITSSRWVQAIAMIISLLLSNWVICDLREMNDLTFLLWIFIMPQESSRRDSSELFNTKIEPVILVTKNENVGTINLPSMSNSIRIDCSKIEINTRKGRTIPQTPILLQIDYHFASLASILDLSFYVIGVYRRLVSMYLAAFLIL